MAMSTWSVEIDTNNEENINEINKMMDKAWNEKDEYSNKISEKLNISKFAADMIQYISGRSWGSNKIMHLVVLADTTQNFDFCCFIRGDYEEELNKHQIKIHKGEYIPDYYNMLYNL
jgi:hypothetical protein